MLSGTFLFVFSLHLLSSLHGLLSIIFFLESGSSIYYISEETQIISLGGI
nr:MAG TPA: hypothetical protein [Caudoviricetes sp.]